MKSPKLHKAKSGRDRSPAACLISRYYRGNLVRVLCAFFPCVGVNVSLGRPIIVLFLVRLGSLMRFNAGAVFLYVALNSCSPLSEGHGTQ